MFKVGAGQYETAGYKSNREKKNDSVDVLETLFQIDIFFLIVSVPVLVIYLEFIYDEINEDRIIEGFGKDYIVAVRARRSVAALIQFEKGIRVTDKRFASDSIHIRSGTRVLLIKNLDELGVVKVAVYTPATLRYSFPVFLVSSYLPPYSSKSVFNSP